MKDKLQNTEVLIKLLNPAIEGKWRRFRYRRQPMEQAIEDKLWNLTESAIFSLLSEIKN